MNKATPRPWKCSEDSVKEWQIYSEKDPLWAIAILRRNHVKGHNNQANDVPFIVEAVNNYERLKRIEEAAKLLMDCLARSDKQWLGLNMANAGQKRAYDIKQEGLIAMEKALNSK